MGSLTLSWSIAVVATLVTAVSAVRMMTTSGEARFAAGGDLLMGLCMVAMSLPATAAWYGGYGLWWSAAFSLLGIGAVALAVKSTRERGWKEGRHCTAVPTAGSPGRNCSRCRAAGPKRSRRQRRARPLAAAQSGVHESRDGASSFTEHPEAETSGGH